MLVALKGKQHARGACANLRLSLWLCYKIDNLTQEHIYWSTQIVSEAPTPESPKRLSLMIIMILFSLFLALMLGEIGLRASGVQAMGTMDTHGN